MQAVEYLLPMCRASLDAPDMAGETAVHTATRRGAFSVLQHLVAAKANVNVTEPNKGRTALHIAGNEGMDPVYVAAFGFTLGVLPCFHAPRSHSYG